MTWLRLWHSPIHPSHSFMSWFFIHSFKQSSTDTSRVFVFWVSSTIWSWFGEYVGFLDLDIGLKEDGWLVSIGLSTFTLRKQFRFDFDFEERYTVSDQVLVRRDALGSRFTITAGFAWITKALLLNESIILVIRERKWTMVLYNSNVVLLGSVGYLVIRLAGLGRAGQRRWWRWIGVDGDDWPIDFQVPGKGLFGSVSFYSSFILQNPFFPWSSFVNVFVFLPHVSGRSKLYWFVSVPLCPSATSKYNQGISVDTVFSFYLDYSNQSTIHACFIAPPPTPLPTPSYHTRSHQQTFKPYGNSWLLILFAELPTSLPFRVGGWVFLR